MAAGLRLHLGDRVSFRVEVRDQLYTTKVDSVNGCNIDDINAMYDKYRQTLPPDSAIVGGGCHASKFTGIDANGRNYGDDIPIAKWMISEQSGSRFFNNVGISAGASVLF